MRNSGPEQMAPINGTAGIQSSSQLPVTVFRATELIPADAKAPICSFSSSREWRGSLEPEPQRTVESIPSGRLPSRLPYTLITMLPKAERIFPERSFPCARMLSSACPGPPPAAPETGMHQQAGSRAAFSGNPSPAFEKATRIIPPGQHDLTGTWIGHC